MAEATWHKAKMNCPLFYLTEAFGPMYQQYMYKCNNIKWAFDEWKALYEVIMEWCHAPLYICLCSTNTDILDVNKMLSIKYTL